VAPFISMAAVFSFGTAYFLYDEVVGLNAVLSFIFLFGALVYHQFSYLKTFRLSKEIYLCLLCSLFWGVSFVLYPISIKAFGVYNFSLILELCVLLSCVYLTVLKENILKLTLPNKADLKVCFWIGLCVAGGNIGANYSLQNIAIYLNIIIAVLFEAVMILAGLYWFKEKLRMRDWVLVTGITVGTVLLML
jgi:drug/metabolite transporter (DMT)-like permease